jgi:uncharacterized protein (TIGR00299 family) protein
MTTLYFDAFAGFSGDMTVGALLSLGVPLERLRAELAKLPLEGYAVAAETRFVNGIGAVKFDVALANDHHHDHGHSHESHESHESHAPHRPYRDIRLMLEQSALDARVKELSLAIFSRLAVAEARVHGVTVDDVAFHEVGAVDSIVDIVGAATGFAELGVERFLVGTIPLGSGIVRSQHGPIPVPGPATAELLAGFVTRPDDGAAELVTPTGAAILAALARQQPVDGFRIGRVGYGAGTRVLHDRPNLLRLLLGDVVGAVGQDDVVLIETNIDDANPEIYDHVMERLFAAGARDVFLTPIQMKKNRPATQLAVLCAPADRDRLAAIVLSETTAIGVRYVPMQRLVLPRESVTVATEMGAVRVKIATGPDGSRNVAPEHDDCRRIALERGVPLKVVYQAALAAAWRA